MYNLDYSLAAYGLSTPVAFLAGILSFFAPCVIPLLPVYLSYITGISLNELKNTEHGIYRKKVLSASLLYVLGFSLVFMLLGGVAGGMGLFLRLHTRIVQAVGGLVMIFFGLELLGYIKYEFLLKERKFVLPAWAGKIGSARAFLLGMIFALAWSPCIGPVLGGILVLAATSASALEGSFLLLVYSLGISLPFLVLALTVSETPKYLDFVKKKIVKFSWLSGAILILIGVALLSGWYPHINSFVLKLFR